MADLAHLIDHTILAPDAAERDVLRFCDEAIAHGFHSVCVNPLFVGRVAAALKGSRVATCSVVGFPFGATLPAIKAAEAHNAVADGAVEIDMVIAIGALKDGDLVHVRRDIEAVRKACAGAILKTIIETSLLTDDEKLSACSIARDAGADFVKTSTGYAKHGATAADVALMRKAVGTGMGVKASGGLRTRAAVETMLAAGATRIGTSSGLAIIGAAAPSAAQY